MPLIDVMLALNKIDSEAYVRLPDTPGPGIDLDEDKLKQYEKEDDRGLI